MFVMLEANINIDDELAALLADYAAFVGDDGLLIAQPLPELTDAALAPAVTDVLPADDTAATTPTDLASDPAPDSATDPATVVDPMASGDTVVFTGATTPATDDVTPPSDAVDTSGDAVPPEATIDLAAVPGLEGLIDLGDGSFAFDLDILNVGRTFGGPSFMDQP